MEMAVISSSTALYPSLYSSRSLNLPINLINIPNHHHHSQNNHHYHNLRYTRSLFICKASSKQNNHEYEAEESRWLREEQRWLREEQRWLREEARWNAERQSLLFQIQHLKSELERLGARNSANFDVDFVLDKMATLLQGMVEDKSSSKSRNQIADFSGKSEWETAVTFDPAGAPPVTPAESESEEEIKTEEEEEEEVKTEVKEKKKMRMTSSLRMGAEGEEVRALQEALMNLGFYSGEEDMEYSSFSSGTERAVKTWQASIGIREDGIVTAELFERLYASQQIQSAEPSSVNADIRKVDEANGAVTEVRDVQQTVAKKVPTDVDINKHRVFLLGENRWEDPSRLNKGNGTQASRVNAQVSATNCPTCRGEGRLLCMECDGTGEPNIEEQFLDWVEEEAKCPYCEGRGYNVCDVCEGKPVS